MSITPFIPVWLLLLASPILFFVPTVMRKALLVGLPLLALAALFYAPNGDAGQIQVLGQNLLLVRLDPLARIFIMIFLLGAFLAGIFAWHRDSLLDHISTLAYAGAAIAAVGAGDLITLFIFWELVSLTSLFIILAARTNESYPAAFRYFMIQILSGLALLSGIVLSKDTSFNAMDATALAGALILFSFGVKAAFPVVGFWMPDAYPQASPSGSVFLSIFTTKLAIYALIRGFAGLEWLIVIGAVMAIVPAIFAIAENNLRRVLSYALNSQLGFMVAGVGVGSALALNGAIAHAFASVVYQALLFMVVGSAILYGKLSQRYLVLCLIGSASIAGAPFFIGFATKSLTMTAALNAGYFYLWLTLLAANAMAVIHTAIRLPVLLFFNDEQGYAPIDKQKTPPPNHIFIAPAIAAFICLAIGVYPQALYAFLPYAASYHPFDFTHIVQHLELIVFASFAGFFLLKTKRSILLDLDWFARGLPYLLYHELKDSIAKMQRVFILTQQRMKQKIIGVLRLLFQQNSYFASAQPTGFMVLWLAILLLAVMVLVLIV